MSPQTFEETVRESRMFFRRRLIEQLAVAQMRKTGGVHAKTVVNRAYELVSGISAIEDRELDSEP